MKAFFRTILVNYKCSCLKHLSLTFQKRDNTGYLLQSIASFFSFFFFYIFSDHLHSFLVIVNRPDISKSIMLSLQKVFEKLKYTFCPYDLYLVATITNVTLPKYRLHYWLIGLTYTFVRTFIRTLKFIRTEINTRNCSIKL